MNEKELKREINKKLDLCDAIRLGCELGELTKKIDFDELVAFLNGETDHYEDFDKLKPLFDEFGYLIVKQAILLCGITT